MFGVWEVEGYVDLPDLAGGTQVDLSNLAKSTYPPIIVYLQVYQVHI